MCRTNDVFKIAMRTIFEEKKKNVSFKYEWSKLYETAKLEFEKVSDKNSLQKQSNVTFGNYLQQAFDLKETNNKINISESKLIKVTNCTKSIADNNFKLVSDTKRVLNAIEKENNLILSCDSNCNKNCCKKFKEGTKQPITETNSIMIKQRSIEINKMRKIRIGDDGNCLFCSFSFAMFGSEDRHEIVRKNITEFVADNWETHGELCNVVHSQLRHLTNYVHFETGNDYLTFMSREGEYGTEFEISIFSLLYGIRVEVFEIRNNEYRLIESYDLDDSNEYIMIVISGAKDKGHFEILTFVEDIVKEIVIPKVLIINEITNRSNSNEILQEKTNVTESAEVVRSVSVEQIMNSYESKMKDSIQKDEVFNFKVDKMDDIISLKDFKAQQQLKRLETEIPLTFTINKDEGCDYGKDNNESENHLLDIISSLSGNESGTEKNCTTYKDTSKLDEENNGKDNNESVNDLLDTVSIQSGSESGTKNNYRKYKLTSKVNEKNHDRDNNKSVNDLLVTVSIQSGSESGTEKHCTKYKLTSKEESNEESDDSMGNCMQRLVAASEGYKKCLEIEKEREKIKRAKKLNQINKERFNLDSLSENLNETFSNTKEIAASENERNEKEEEFVESSISKYTIESTDNESDSSSNCSHRKGLINCTENVIMEDVGSSHYGDSNSDEEIEQQIIERNTQQYKKKINNKNTVKHDRNTSDSEESSDEKLKKERNKRLKYNVDICDFKIPAQKIKDYEKDQIDLKLLKDASKLMFIEDCRYPCLIYFYSNRRNDKASNTIVFYGKCTYTHIQHYRFEAFNLSEPSISVSVKSHEEMQDRHDEMSSRKYQQIRGKQREKLKEVFKYRNPRDFQLENNQNIDIELWHDGHPQNAVRLPTVQKISSEQNLKGRLKLHSLDLQDVIQFWLNECSLSDPYFRFLEFPLKTIMFTEKQQQLLHNEKGPKIAHMDGTSNVARIPDGLKCSKIMNYVIVCKLLETCISGAEMLTVKSDTNALGMFLKRYKNFLITHHYPWPFYNAIVVDWSWAEMHAIVEDWNNMEFLQYLNATFDYLENGKNFPLLTILLTCISHILHRVPKTIKKYFPHLLKKRNFLMDIFALLLLGRNMMEVDVVYEDMLRLLLTKDKDKAEQSLLQLTAMAKVQKNEELEELRK